MRLRCSATADMKKAPACGAAADEMLDHAENDGADEQDRRIGCCNTQRSGEGHQKSSLAAVGSCNAKAIKPFPAEKVRAAASSPENQSVPSGYG
jgi:hypothetical protein